ncbi:MAG TPA: hypothetical protein VHC20_01715 [Candidatus Paceibacterota bacterium]|nr:hypothetical protein [Candidatus Paceibacterota bacterium]
MSDVTFNEPQYGSAGGPRGPEPSFFSKIMIGLGLATDEASAQRALGYTAAAIALLAIIVYVWSHY